MSELLDQSNVQKYFQPPAGNTEKYINLKPVKILEGLISSYNCLKHYTIHNFGKGFEAAEFILKHIVNYKLDGSFQIKKDLWHKTVSVKLQCEVLSVKNTQSFFELKPTTAEDIDPDFAATEGPCRLADIYAYAEKFSRGEDVCHPLYVTGEVLNYIGANIDQNMIFMMDGARRVVAAALTHQPIINVYLLMLENEYAKLIKTEHLEKLSNHIRQIRWFDSYQSIPLVGLQGQRSLNRFDLIDMSALRDQTVMDFGCNLGQSCIRAVQAGAKKVIGVEGMKDTYRVAGEIGKTIGFTNLHYLNVDFNNLNFKKKIDEYYPHNVDFSFFLSVYRTKELTQRDKLFQYIINKTNKGIFFEGHAHPKIDTIEYYDWLFECFKLKYNFLGYSEPNLRPLFLCSIESRTFYRKNPQLTDKTIDESQIQERDENNYSVSAIISIYKSEKDIEGKILDLLNQTIGEELEIIIIGSNSLENEKAIITKYTQKYKNIKYIRTEDHEGLYSAWNRGIKAAHGKYITNAYAEYRLRPDALEILKNELDKNCDIALAYGDCFITIFEKQEFYNHVCCGYSIKPDYDPNIMLSGCHMGPQPMWRKSVHDEIGYFAENFQYAGEYEFWCRLATKYSMKHIKKFIGLYYHNTQKIVNRDQYRYNFEVSQIKDKYKDKFPPPIGQIPTGYYFKEHVNKVSYVNICMVTYNRLSFTKQAIESILNNTKYPHVITVVDNNSQDGTKEYLLELNREGVIKNLAILKENVGVAKASNLAWYLEQNSDYYLKFDNDIVIKKHDWLLDMVKSIDSIPELGAIAYNFEPYSYPSSSLNGIIIRIKKHNNLGGACILIPKRTSEQLGFWCEDYGLYGEEDADYGERIRLNGLLNAYMENENIGIHLPGGKAARIDPKTLNAQDGAEEIIHSEYRQWKDYLRRKILKSGLFKKKVEGYRKGEYPLYVESDFRNQIFNKKNRIKKTEMDNLGNNLVAQYNYSQTPKTMHLIKTSIIIVTYNSSEYIKMCLESIKTKTQLNYEIIIIDNCSSDGTADFLKTLKNEKIILNSKNLGFSKGCNQGIEVSKGEYIVLLNPDTVVTDKWDSKLISHFSDGVGAVGPLSNYVAGKQKYEFYTNERLTTLDNVDLLTKNIYRQNKGKNEETKLLIGFCLMIKRKVIDEVGMLDEALFLGNDDLDLSLRLRNEGYRLLVAIDTFIYHKGQVSFESEPAEKTNALVQESTNILYQKLEEQYGPGRAPNSQELWDIGWFKPKQPARTNNKTTSIILITYNQLRFTIMCIESIFKYTNKPFELIIVDNGSSDGTVDYLKYEVPRKNTDVRVKIVINEKNIGFAGGNNQGIAAANGEYILLLNNDVVVTPGWLERLIYCIEGRPEIGIVGPKSNCVSGPQLVEAIDYDLDSLYGLTRFSELFAKKNVQKSKRLLRVVGFCMLIKRSVIDKIGGLDDRYGIGNFEDDDFSIRAALAGFESWMAEDCFVHHYGSRTFIGEKIDYRKSLQQNWKIFKEKWGLPDDLPYGSPYSISQMKGNEFNPHVHYIPLSGYNENTMENWIENVSTVEQEYSTVCSSFDKENLEIAIEKLQGFADKYKDFALVYNDLGVFYYQTGNNESALKHYRKALNLDQKNISFRKNLADLLAVAFAEYEEALQHYVTVLASEPKDVEALLATGHICVRLERYDDAAEFYEKVLENEPHNSDAQNWLAKMREKSPANFLEFDLNSCYLTLLSEIAQEDLTGAITKIENFIEMYPTHGQAHNDLGVLFYKNESKTKVLAHYLKAVELEPKNVTFRKNLADFLYVEEGRVEEALENYIEVLRIIPDDVETLLITGHICAAIKRFEDAMRFYHKVLKIEPGNTDARKNLEALERRQVSMLYKEERGEEKTNAAAEINQAEPHASVDEVPIEQDGVVAQLINKANLLFQQERIDQAVDSMLKAIAVNPSDGRTYVELAEQLVNHGRHENALEVLAEMPTNQPVALVMQKLLVEGYAEEGMGNYAAAKKCCDSVLDSEPNYSKTLNLNGILAYRNGDKATAVQHFKRAIELDSEYGEPHTNLGALVWETSEPKMALEHYERGFSLSPTDIDMANAYHEAVTATGEYERAEKAARSALKKYPQCRKVLYMLIDTLIRQEKTKEALNELETALSNFGIDEGLLDTALAFREQVGKTKKTRSAKKPGVSLCMIVKDEENNLARCLASVKPIVDEMIVVDTGSTDRTRDIAEFFGARVFYFEWRGDFAEARNFSLSKAEGNWILIMDADEVISALDHDHFRKLTDKRPSKITAYSIVTRNYCYKANTVGWNPNDGYYAEEEAGIGWLPSEKVRLFSNKKIIKFEGAVHEMVDPLLKRSNIKILKCEIPVHHYGRLNTHKLDQKDQTYYDIGCKKLSANRGDIGAVRELAIQATVLEKNSEAIELWQKFLSMKPENKVVPEAFVNMGTVYIRMKDYKKALIFSRKAVKVNPDMKEAQYNLGMAELYNGNATAAVRTLKRLIKSHPDFPPARFMLAASKCCKKYTTDSNGDMKKLKQSFFGPVLTYSVAELADGLMTAGQHKLAFRLIQNAIENEIVSKDILHLFSVCLKRINAKAISAGEVPQVVEVPQETTMKCN